MLAGVRLPVHLRTAFCRTGKGQGRRRTRPKRRQTTEAPPGRTTEPETSDTRRLDLALITLHPGLSRRRARSVIEKGQVKLEGTVVTEAGQLITPGDRIEWDPNRKAEPRVRSSLPVLYRDQDLVVIDKPAGLLSVPTAPEALDEDTALRRVQELARHLTPRRPFVGAVHRLDRDTSGALAFALTSQVRQALRALFREHRVERRYAALVSGEPSGAAGEVDLPIHDRYQAGKRRIAGPDEPSKPALTRWRVVERFRGAALLEVTLATGRQHQIRLHLSHIGLPILGDPVYGQEVRRLPLRLPRQMLHARLLAFTQPLTGRPLRVESPLPGDFMRVLAVLRRHARRRPGALA